MLYSENELNKRLRSGCGLYYFYAADEALVHTAAQKALKVLNEDDPETTVLDGPAPRVEEIVLAAGTISFFGGRAAGADAPHPPVHLLGQGLAGPLRYAWPTPKTPSSS